MNILPTPLTNKLQLLTILTLAASMLWPQSVGAATIKVNDEITVPLTLSASLPVVIVDITVTVQGGSLLNLQCGGSGFSVTASSSTKCTLLHTGTGATSGTIAIATVKATTPGSLTVSADSTLKGALNTPVSGQVAGASHTVISTEPTGTADPDSQEPPSKEPTSSKSKTTNSSSKPTTNPAPTKSDPQDNEDEQPSTPDNQPSQTGVSTSTATTATTTVAGDTIVITQELAASGIVVLPTMATKVVFAEDSLATTQTPLVVVLPPYSVVDPTLDFSAFTEQSDNGQDKTVLPQPVRIEKANAEVQGSTTLPANADIKPSTNRCRASEFDGAMSAIRIVSDPGISIPNGIVEVSVDVGRDDCEIEFALPIQIDFPKKAGRLAAFRSFEQTAFTDINDNCVAVEQRPQLPEQSETCTFNHDDGTLTVLSRHATTFIAYRQSANYLVWIIIALVGLFVIAVGAFIYWRFIHKKKQSPQPPVSEQSEQTAQP